MIRIVKARPVEVRLTTNSNWLLALLRRVNRFEGRCEVSVPGVVPPYQVDGTSKFMPPPAAEPPVIEPPTVEVKPKRYNRPRTMSRGDKLRTLVNATHRAADLLRPVIREAIVGGDRPEVTIKACREAARTKGLDERAMYARVRRLAKHGVMVGMGKGVYAKGLNGWSKIDGSPKH